MGQMQEEQYSTKTGVGVHAHEAPMVTSVFYLNCTQWHFGKRVH